MKKIMMFVAMVMYVLLLSAFVKATCTDSDGGMVYTTYGYVTDPDGSWEDYCLKDYNMSGDERLAESFCSAGYVDYTLKDCKDYGSQYICENGACRIGCTDSDGLNYENRGYVFDIMYPGTTFWDECEEEEGDILWEQYCFNGSEDVSDISCSDEFGGDYMCENGKCTSEASHYSCNDTDAGDDIGTKGTVSLYYDGVLDDTYTDTCHDDVTLWEGVTDYCEDGLIYTVEHTCSNFCVDGVCSDTNCSDSDGTNFFNKGYVVDNAFPGTQFWDECENNVTLWEKYCSGIGLDFIEKSCKFFGMNYMCYDGACIVQAENCTDSDETDYNTKGYVIDNYGTYWDYCLSNVSLIERVCSGEWMSYITIDCGSLITPNYTCSEGTCNAVSLCTDSDNGVNYYVKGTTTISGIGSYTDYCLAVGGNDNYVAEYYCEDNGGLGLIANRFCEYDCVDGACVSLTPTNPDVVDSDSPWYRDEEGVLKFNGTKCEGWKSMIACAGFKYSQKQVVKGTSWIFSGIHILYFMVVLIIIIIIGPLIVEFFKKR